MSERRQYTIYALLDPRADAETPEAVFYVGQTNNPKTRLWGHIKRAEHDQRRNEPCIEYIREILAAGVKPELVVLECGTGDEGERKAAEDRWIAHYLALGAHLRNAQEGGRSGYRHGAETRAKMSKAIQTIKRTPEHRQKHAEAVRRALQDPRKHQNLVDACRVRGARRAGFESVEELIARDAAILALYESGTQRQELAARFGIKPGDVGNAIQRARRRANVPHVDRATRAEARRALRTHCKNGHPWKAETIRWDARVGSWRCVICENATKRRWEEKNRGKRKRKVEP